MKKIQVIIICIFIIFLFLFSETKKTIKEEKIYEWNNGHCVEDGGRLIYIGTGSMTHYQCEICGKEYTFKGVQKYE